MTAVMAAYAALFIACAATDVLSLRIPNVFVGALIALFVFVCIVHPRASIWTAHVAPALVAFVFGAAIFFAGKMGGGDVKLLTAAVLWVGLPKLGFFLISLAIYGMMAILVFSVFRRQVVGVLAWASVRIGRPIPTPVSLETGQSIPYGVVIAAAALMVGPGLNGGGL